MRKTLKILLLILLVMLFVTLTTSHLLAASKLIEAEDYVYMNGIQVEDCAEGGENVGWIHRGDWMEYSVNIATSGRYKVEYRVASPYSTGKLNIGLGSNELGSVAIPNTGGWQNWTTVSNYINLSAGQQTLSLYAAGDGFNINWFRLTPQQPQPDPDGKKFTFAVIPDTQVLSETESGAEMMKNATRWLVNQKETLNLQFVSSLGDMTQWGSQKQWMRVEESTDILTNNGVRFSPALGNHDNLEGLRATFPVSEYREKSWFEGYLGGMENACYLFSAGGMKFVLVVLETHDQFTEVYDWESINWANQKFSQYSSRHGILVTHDFYENKRVVDDVIKKNDNLFLAVCGHSSWNNGEDYWTETTNGGSTVHCILSDYQDWASGGEGMIRYYTFKPSEGRVYAHTYNPTTGSYETDSDSQFSFPCPDYNSDDNPQPIDGITEGKYYKIVAKHSGQVLDVSGGNTSNGANVKQWSYKGYENQKWKFESVGNGYYKIIAKHSNKVLDVEEASTSEGANVHQWDYVGNSNQKWKLEPLGNGYYKIKVKHSGQVLDVSGVSSDQGANVQQWNYGGGENQKWKIVEVSSNDDENDNNEEWDLVWRDEFNYSGLPDPSKWSYDVGAGKWGNNELQYYTEKRLKNARVENGHLIIEARKDYYGGRDYSSARLVTKNKGDWLYGRIEVRAKLPGGRGVWPAIWMLPTDWVYGGWPDSGEIDIMEHVGFEPRKIYGSVHTEAYNHMKRTQKTGSIEGGDWETAFHTYAIEWHQDKIDFIVDGNVYHSFSKHGGPAKWPFDQRFHLILNIAVGGDWGGAEGVDSNIWPQRMEVDYVRVYQK